MTTCCAVLWWYVVMNAINLDGGGSATMTQNHSLISDPSWLCETDNPKSLFRCEKKVASITCIHAAPPPIFVPVETTWANYSNITAAAAAATAAAVAAAAAAEAEAAAEQWRLEHTPCPNITIPAPIIVQEIAASSTSDSYRKEASRYRLATWTLAFCLAVSFLINTLPLWYRLCHKKVGQSPSQPPLKPSNTAT